MTWLEADDPRHRYSTYFLIALLFVFLFVAIASALNSEDIDEICSQNNSLLYRNETEWICRSWDEAGNASNESIWVNVSRVATYYDSANITGSLTVGDTVHSDYYHLPADGEYKGSLNWIAGSSTLSLIYRDGITTGIKMLMRKAEGVAFEFEESAPAIILSRTLANLGDSDRPFDNITIANKISDNKNFNFTVEEIRLMNESIGTSSDMWINVSRTITSYYDVNVSGNLTSKGNLTIPRYANISNLSVTSFDLDQKIKTYYNGTGYVMDTGGYKWCIGKCT